MSLVFNMQHDDDGHPTGREIVFYRGNIVADIVSDGFGRGGWVSIFRDALGKPTIKVSAARTRDDAHELVAAYFSWVGKRKADPFPASADSESLSPLAPVISDVRTHESRNPQGDAR